MKQKYIFLLAILLIIIITYSFFKGTKGSNQPSQTTKHSASPLPKEVTIELGKNGFSPKEVTIKNGTAVRWKNVSGTPQTVNSDDYPTNRLHKELNFGVFANGSSLVYIFTKPGTYGYHNQFNHEQKGKIIVTQ